MQIQPPLTGVLFDNTSRHFRDQSRSSLRKVSSHIKMEALSKDKPHKTYSPERPQKQPEHLSFDKQNFWKFALVLVYKTYTINKNLTDIGTEVTTIPVFCQIGIILTRKILIHSCLNTLNLVIFMNYHPCCIFQF